MVAQLPLAPGDAGADHFRQPVQVHGDDAEARFQFAAHFLAPRFGAEDPDSDTLVFTLLTALQKCTFDTMAGVLGWTPVPAELALNQIALGIPIGVALGAGLGIVLAQTMDRLG